MTWLTAGRRARLLIPLVVVGTAVVTMVVGLWHPDRIFFDEVYYVNDARDFLEFGVEDGFVVHPPLGKLLIATGIWLVGDTALGWRLVGGLLAVASVWLTYLLARRLGLRRSGAALAGIALALDGVFIAQARTAMLDIHLAFFVVLGAYALVRDRDRLRGADDRALAARAEADLAPTRPAPFHDPDVAPPEPATAAPAPAGTPAAEQATTTTVLADRDDDRAAEDRVDDQAVEDPVDGEATDERAAVATARRPDEDDEDDDEDPATAPVLPDDRVPTTTSGEPVRATLPRVGRGWLLMAGLAFGAAVAVKWSGALALVAAGLVWLVVELARRRRVTGRIRTRLPGALALGVVALGIVPVLTYAATWIPWYAAFDQSWIAGAHCDDVGDELDCDGVVGQTRALASYHERMITFHLDLEAEHAYRAEAWNWPIQRRPVVFYYETCSADRRDRVLQTDSDGVVTTPEPCRVQSGEAAEILDLGNPAAWWLLLAALPIAGMMLRRRDRNVLLVLAFYAAQFLPWLVTSRPVFNFYTVPLVPFVALLLALLVDRVTSRDAWVRATGLGLLAGSVVLVATIGFAAIGRPMLEPARWYLVGIAALVGGVLVAPTTPDRSATRRRWPTLLVLAAVVAVGVYFLPVWTGLAFPEEFVKSHWWLPTWI